MTQPPTHSRVQQIEENQTPDKDKIMTEFHHRLHSKLNNQNVGQYVKTFLQ